MGWGWQENSHTVDGIIASIGKNTETYDHFRKVHEMGIPIVLFDRTTDDLEVSRVVIDDHLGAYKVVEHLIQLDIPEQVALAGFSNDPFTSLTDPPLTSVDQLSVTIGNITAELFFEHFRPRESKFVPQKTILKPELIIRQSSLKKPIIKESMVLPNGRK